MGNVLEYVLRMQDKFSQTMGKASAAARHFSDQAAKAEERVNKLNKTMGQMSSAMNGIKKLAGVAGVAFGGYEAFQFMSKGIDAALNKEGIKAAYEGLLKNKQTAEEIVKMLDDSKGSTVFGEKNMFDAGQRLLSAGVKASNLKTIMEQLGDVAKGSGTDIGELADAYSTAMQKGFVETRRVMAIPGMMKEIERMTGKTGKDLMSFMAEGTIGIEDFNAALRNMTGEQGMYFNQVNAYLETNAGKVAEQQRKIEQLQESIGEKLMPAKMMWVNIQVKLAEWTAKLITWADKHKEVLKKVARAVLAMVAAWGMYKGVVMAQSFIGGLNALSFALKAVSANSILAGNGLKSVLAVLSGNPLGIILAAAAGLAIYGYSDAVNKLKGSLGDPYKEEVNPNAQKWKQYLQEAEDNDNLMLQMRKKYYSDIKDFGETEKTVDEFSERSKNFAKGIREKYYGDIKTFGGKEEPAAFGAAWNRPPEDDITKKLKSLFNPSDTMDGITGGGVRNMTINLGKFFDQIVFQGTTVEGDSQTATDVVVKQFLRLLNSANKIQTGAY